MIELKFGNDAGAPLDILCLGCHSDDIEIGCGGSVLRLAEAYPNALFHWVVFSANSIRRDEACRAAKLFAGDRLRGPMLHGFRDGFMPFEGAAVKEVFEQLKREVSPHLIFTHNRADAHQDHRLIAELTWNTFRSHFILEYEIPKYDGDMGRPGVFVPIDAGLCQKKADYIVETFGSQRAKHWFDRETFLSLMRLRGMECNSSSGYAEAFYCRKLVIG
jgi:LmbE family N-acetylglucosaminyl deacetylase